MPVFRRRARLSRLRFDRINKPAAKIVRERNVDTNELYARGLRRRKKMFGEADVEQRMAASGEFGAPLQNIINAYVYGDIWERSGLSDDIRSLVMLGITAASNKPAEFRVHAKGALANGCTREQVQDVLLLVALYCGVPSAIETNRIAAEIFGEAPDPAPGPAAKP
jgi:4-carboxymuconolactone decarboxylase